MQKTKQQVIDFNKLSKMQSSCKSETYQSGLERKKRKDRTLERLENAENMVAKILQAVGESWRMTRVSRANLRRNEDHNVVNEDRDDPSLPVEAKNILPRNHELQMTSQETLLNKNPHITA